MNYRGIRRQEPRAFGSSFRTVPKGRQAMSRRPIVSSRARRRAQLEEQKRQVQYVAAGIAASAFVLLLVSILIVGRAYRDSMETLSERRIPPVEARQEQTSQELQAEDPGWGTVDYENATLADGRSRYRAINEEEEDWGKQPEEKGGEAEENDMKVPENYGDNEVGTVELE